MAPRPQDLRGTSGLRTMIVTVIRAAMVGNYRPLPGNLTTILRTRSRGRLVSRPSGWWDYAAQTEAALAAALDAAL